LDCQQYQENGKKEKEISWQISETYSEKDRLKQEIWKYYQGIGNPSFFLHFFIENQEK
jgi:hypothetical protein